MKSQQPPQQRRVEMPAPRKGSGQRIPSPASPATAPAPQPVSPPRPGPDPTQPPRLSVPDRQQLLAPVLIDDLLEPDHPARAVWAYVEELDLTPLYDRIRARGSWPGRRAIDPRLLVALWLYATLSGFSSAREIAVLCTQYDPFIWLAGGVSVNYHSLSDFHTDDPEFVEQLLKQSVEVLRQRGLVDLGRIAEDGVRVRASAGAASFRRRATLERLLREARAEVRRLEQELAGEATRPAGTPRGAAGPTPTEGRGRSRRQRAAARRHAKDRVKRIEQALERIPEMEAKIAPDEDKEARVSTTDPQATVMKMADGGFRPAYNVEYSTDCGSLVIVGVEVVTVGSDQGQMPPMLDQIEQRFGQRPSEVLVDNGFARFEDIELVQAGGVCKVYAPVPAPRKEGGDRYAPRATDGEEVAEWRERMGTDEAKEIYKERAATAECVNAQARNRGMRQFLVRGLEKVKTVATWFAIVHNMARSFVLLPQPAIVTGYS